MGQKNYVISFGLFFLELEAAFCKQYQTIQNDEYVFIAFRVIKAMMKTLKFTMNKSLNLLIAFNIRWMTTY
jgi:hypothetical protein